MSHPVNDPNETASGPGGRPLLSNRHPSWCVTEECGVEHATRRTVINSLVGYEPVETQMRQARHPAAQPYVVVESDGCRIADQLNCVDGELSDADNLVVKLATSGRWHGHGPEAYV
jgi:hypothetical protein